MHRKMRILQAIVVVFFHLGSIEVNGYVLQKTLSRVSGTVNGDRLLEATIRVFNSPGDTPLQSIEIADPSDPVTIASCIFAATTGDSFTFRIDGSLTPSQFQNEAGTTDLGCTFTDSSNGNYEFIFRVRGNATEMLFSDKDYTFTITNDREFGNIVDTVGTQSFDIPIPQTVQVLTASYQAITTTFSIVDDNSDVVTSLALGEPFKLVLETSINPFREGGIEGARLTSCVVANNDFFTTPITIIDANGCFVDNSVFSNVDTTVGFSKDASSSTANTQGATKNYVAMSPVLEVGSPTSGAASGGTNKLNFRCSIEYCKNDQNGGPGCGGNHCNSARKRRNADQKKETIVTASVSLKAAKTKEKCQSCSETMLYKVVIGGGATAAAILFGLMMYLFFDLEHKIKVATIKKRARMEENSRGSSTRTSSLTS